MWTRAVIFLGDEKENHSSMLACFDRIVAKSHVRWHQKGRQVQVLKTREKRIAA
jgi:hypothetical protein